MVNHLGSDDLLSDQLLCRKGGASRGTDEAQFERDGLFGFLDVTVGRVKEKATPIAKIYCLRGNSQAVRPFIEFVGRFGETKDGKEPN